uniref:Actin-related protein 10 n=1 Tax=Meloidogyne incognita TaxID=6306 RepID=A0A914MFH5_MELIC
MEQINSTDKLLVNGKVLDQPIALLVDELFKVDWNPFVEHRRYITMEGHMEIYNANEEDPEQIWKRLYFRTKDGRFQWFASHCADEHPISDVLLTGTEIKANREDWTLLIKGGKENADLLVRVPSNVFDKWHQTLLSHSSSSLLDAYIQPVWPAVPHRTNRIILLEIGGHSLRAGILTQKPALPYTFIPLLCALHSENDHLKFVASGKEAILAGKQENYNLVQPIRISEEETYLDRAAMIFLLQRFVQDMAMQAREMDISFRPQNFSVLMSIPEYMDIEAASDILKMLLDKSFGFRNVGIVRQPSLVLYSYDVTTGVVVFIGEHFSIVPIIDEFVVQDAVNLILPYGAKQIRDKLRTKLDLKGWLNALDSSNSSSATVEKLLLRFLVEKSCFVAANGYDSERQKGSKEMVVELPGTSLSLKVDGEIRFSAPEGIFKPSLWGKESAGLHQLVHEAIQRCPIDSRRPLYRAIYLTGGCSLLRGLTERLELEISKLVPPSIPVQVLNSPWRRHSAFLGAHQISAASDEFPRKCCVGESELDDYLRRMSTPTTME